MGSSGGGGGNTTTTQHFEPPANTQPGWDQYIQNAMNLSNKPYETSGLPTVAPWNDFQQAAAQGTYDRALNGAPDLNAGRAAVTGIASGNMGNPWQQNFADLAAGGGPANPFMKGVQGLAQGAPNAMMNQAAGFANGQNKNQYYADPNALIASTTANMTKAAKEGAMAQTDAMANRAGAYGGSDWQNLQSKNAANLASQVGQMDAQTRMAANQQNAGIQQNDFQNMLAGIGMGGQFDQQNTQNRLGASGLGANMFQQAMQNMMQAGQIGGGMYQNDIQNMLGASGLAGSLSQDDWTSFQNLFNMGSNQGAYQQALLNSGNDQFNQQQMYPYLQNEQLGGALSRGSGQGGTSTSTQQPPGYNYWANGLGLLGAGYGLTH